MASKAAGIESISGRILKDCPDMLTIILTQTSNLSFNY